MRDINLSSGIIRLDGFPKETKKIMILHDERGWAIRCYSDNGPNNKITTMVPDTNLQDKDIVTTLVPRERIEATPFLGVSGNSQKDN